MTSRLVPLAIALAASVTLAAAVAPSPPQIVGTPGQTGQARDPSQPPPPRQMAVGSGTISGTVTMIGTGKPIAGVRVTVAGTATMPERMGAAGRGAVATGLTVTGRGGAVDAPPAGQGRLGGFSPVVNRTVLTDSTGRFTFERLPAGQFRVSASKNRLLSSAYGARRVGDLGSTIALGDHQQFTANILMTSGGVITGTVSDESGEPVPGAQVSAWRYVTNNGVRRPQQSSLASTDDRGTFRLSNLAPGDYLVSATPSNADANQNARLMEQYAAVEQAILTGAVLPPAQPGYPSTVVVPTPAASAGPIFFQPTSYLPTFYPGTPIRKNASMVHIDGADEKTNTDFGVQHVQAATIEGIVSTPLKPGITARVTLISDDPWDQPRTAQLAPELQGRAARDAADAPANRFTFRGVGPGNYTIVAETFAAPAPMTYVNGVVTSLPSPAPRMSDEDRLWGRTTVNISDGSTVNAQISLQPGRTISGLVAFETERPPDLTRARVMVTASNAPGSAMQTQGPLQGQVGPDGRFTIVGVPPGWYILRAANGSMKSSIVNGQDTLDFPLQFTGDRDISDALLTVTDKTTQLSGVLTDGLKPIADYTVIVAAADSRFWLPGSRRIALSRTSTDGAYQFRNLPPGEYFLAVVSDLENGEQYDPDVLKALAGNSTRITLTEGQTLSQNLAIKVGTAGTTGARAPRR